MSEQGVLSETEQVEVTVAPPRARRPGWFGDWSSTATHHSPWEDAQGIAASVLMISLGISLFRQTGLITSGIAGWSLVLHYISGTSVGILFFVLNAPFYLLAIARLGWMFTLKTMAAVALLSVLVDLEAGWLVVAYVHPLFAAILGGVLMGFGLLGVFRHRASVGGISIVAVWLQDLIGLRAGITLILFDLTVFGTALFVAPLDKVIYSLIGAITLNAFLAVNHRNDRYLAR